MKKILIVVTNHATLGDTDQANGTYAVELTHPLNVFLEAGYEYDIASIKGGQAPIYGAEVEGDEINRKILSSKEFQDRFNNTIPVSQLKVNDYDAIYYPGGFGLLSDLATNDEFAKLSAEHYEKGGVLGSVCHGPAGFLPITLSNGESLIANKTVTGFTREEEIDFGTIDDIPFLLEESLTRLAAQYSKRQPWQVHVIDDNRVITGQNPQSAHGVGQAIVKRLSN
ncbi:MAG: type 1 glutamine amidotransferase domain-containing protein [Halioglobus sp.]